MSSMHGSDNSNCLDVTLRLPGLEEDENGVEFGALLETLSICGC